MKPVPTRIRPFAFVVVLMSALLVAGVPAVSEGTGATEGTWVSKQYKVAGEWQIAQDGDDRFLVLSADFKTKKGPDLKIFLSPQSLDQVTGETATDGAVLLALLDQPKGEQRFEIPSGIDLSDYQSILIHCEKYSVLWGGASL